MPPEMYSVSPVIQRESAEARNTAAGAMSLGWPMRPSGVCASICLRKSLSVDAGGVDAFGFDHAGVDGVDADFPRAEFLGQRLGDGIDGGLGGAVDRAFGGATVAATELMLMMLPPAGRIA